MKKVIVLAIFACTLLTSWSGLAATETVYANPGLCDFHKRVCANIRITLSINEKIMEISGRLYKPAGAGQLIFFLEGLTPIDETVSHHVSIAVDGQYNEILRTKFQPPLSNQTKWTLKEMVFDPKPK